MLHEHILTADPSGMDELANIAIESSHTVDIEKFVPKASIDNRYRDTPYSLLLKTRSARRRSPSFAMP